MLSKGTPNTIDKKLAKQMTISFTSFDISKLYFTTLEENDRSKGQKIAYPRYEHNNEYPLLIQFPWFQLSSYGIPRLGEYYKDDSQRLFIKIPLDQSISEIKNFSNFLKTIDNKLASQEFKEQLFGTKANKYVYQPIFRMPQEEDDDDDEIKTKKKYNGPKHPYMKLKIDATYPDNKIISTVFLSTLENNQKIRKQVENITTLDDFNNYVCFMSRIHPIVRPVKLWAQSLSKKDPSYGLTFKLIKLEVEPPQNNTSKIKDYLKIDEFLSSDSDNEKPGQASSDKTELHQNKEAEDDDDEDEDEEKENEDEDEDDEDAESDDSAPIVPQLFVEQKVNRPKAKAKK
jgi:hypothetical protein